VKHPAVDDRVETHPEPSEAQHVAHLEPDGHTALRCLGASPADRHRRDVDADHVRPAGGGQQRVLAGAAPRVQQRPAQQPPVGQPDERGLRPADVPR